MVQLVLFVSSRELFPTFYRYITIKIVVRDLSTTQYKVLEEINMRAQTLRPTYRPSTYIASTFPLAYWFIPHFPASFPSTCIYTATQLQVPKNRGRRMTELSSPTTTMRYSEWGASLRKTVLGSGVGRVHI